jgi:hypothetical protein
MTTHTPLAASSVGTDRGRRPPGWRVRAWRALAGTLAVLAIAGVAAPAAAADKPKPDGEPGYQDLRMPDTQDAAAGRYPPPNSPSDDGPDWGDVGIGAGVAGAVVLAIGGLTRRRHGASSSSGAAA